MSKYIRKGIIIVALASTNIILLVLSSYVTKPVAW